MTTVLVTGANRGIGLELARQYAESGADVLACCRKPNDATELKKIASQTGKVKLFALEATDPDSVRRLRREVGDAPIDILVNNAGVAGPRPQSADAIDYDQWLTTFRVNSMAPLIVAQAFKENLKRSRDRKLIVITSGLGSIANTDGGDWYGYRASKAAVNSVMHGLSKDWAKDGILVGIFAPGWVRTDMGGSAAPLSPEQSVTNVRKRIAELTAKNSGHYIDHDGHAIAW